MPSPPSPPWPRPVLVALSRDVPSAKKEALLVALSDNLPGVFTRVDVYPINAAAVQEAMDLGNSVVLDVTIGHTAASRRAFLEEMEILRNTLHPRPQCVLIQGHPLNRRGGGQETDLGVDRKLRKKMPDWPLKYFLEDAAEQLRLLEDEERVNMLRDVSTMIQPPSASEVLLLEAVIVLMSPQYTYREPDKAVASVTWPAARRLASDPVRLVKRLRACDLSSIPVHNLTVLKAYRSHPRWPKSGGVTLKFGDAGPLGRLLHWVNCAIDYAMNIEEIEETGWPGERTHERQQRHL